MAAPFVPRADSGGQTTAPDVNNDDSAIQRLLSPLRTSGNFCRRHLPLDAARGPEWRESESVSLSSLARLCKAARECARKPWGAVSGITQGPGPPDKLPRPSFPFCQRARSATCAGQTKVAMRRNSFGCIVTEFAAADFPRQPIFRQVALPSSPPPGHPPAAAQQAAAAAGSCPELPWAAPRLANFGQSGAALVRPPPPHCSPGAAMCERVRRTSCRPAAASCAPPPPREAGPDGGSNALRERAQAATTSGVASSAASTASSESSSSSSSSSATAGLARARPGPPAGGTASAARRVRAQVTASCTASSAARIASSGSRSAGASGAASAGAASAGAL